MPYVKKQSPKSKPFGKPSKRKAVDQNYNARSTKNVQAVKPRTAPFNKTSKEKPSADQSTTLRTTLWNIADTLRGKMDADDFRDYILGFIFYKYLSEKMHAYADTILKPDKLKYEDIEKHKNKKAYIAAIRDAALDKL